MTTSEGRLTQSDVDAILERFDQTEPALQRQIVAELVRQLAAVRRERDERRKDSARIDWLSAAGTDARITIKQNHTFDDGTGQIIWRASAAPMLREAIDAAMEKDGGV